MSEAEGVTEWVTQYFPRFGEFVSVETNEALDEPVILWEAWFDVQCEVMGEDGYTVVERLREDIPLRSKVPVVRLGEAHPHGINNFLQHYGFHMSYEEEL